MKYTRAGWWIPKLVCIIAACVLWIFVMHEQNPLVESSYTIPVEVKNLDRSMVALNVPQHVSVRIQMNRNQLMKLRSEDLEAYIDLKDISSAGDYSGTPIKVNIPVNGKLISVTPDSIDLKVDTYSVRSVPVTVQYFGDAAKGFAMSGGTAIPDTVTIAGSSTAVMSVNRAVVSINIADKKGSFDQFGAVNLLDANGDTVRNVEVVPPTIKVTVNMKEDRKQLSVPLKAAASGQPAQGYVIGGVSVAPSSVTLTGSASILGNVQEWQAGSVDVSGADKNVDKVVTIPTPDGGAVFPAEAHITVTIRPAEGR